MRIQEINDRFDNIVNFSGIGKFLDTPLKHYSSGMYVRLGFAVAVSINPDILLVDEVLSVGDLEFQRKSQEKMLAFKKQGKTLVLVSHDLSQIEKLCDRVLVFEKGRIIKQKKPSLAIDEYKLRTTSKFSEGQCQIEKTKVVFRNELIVSVSFKVDQVLVDSGFAIGLTVTRRGQKVLAQRNYFLSETKIGKTKFVLDHSILPKGKYSLSLNVTDQDVTRIYTARENFYSLSVK